MFQNTNRRDFMKQGAALSTALWVGNQTAYAAPKSPLEKINFACIGVAGKGNSDSSSAAQAGNVVAICDIDDLFLKKKAADRSFRRAERFNDYREMLTSMEKDIDAVTVSTPDHSHAAASLMAMKLGKGCFCQKPLTWSIKEARMMREMSEEKGVATQMGNQGTSNTGLREAVEIVRAGDIGDVTEVHVWTNRPVWPSGISRPEGEETPPANVNWDLFLGPAAQRPYSDGYHPFKWRGWVDFGTGALGDMACHTANMPIMALNLFDPISVELMTEDGIFEGETYPNKSIIKFEFPATDERGAVTFFWYDGGNLPGGEIAEAIKGLPANNSGCILKGSEGYLYSPNDYGSEFFLLPQDKYADYKKPEPTLPRSPGHFDEYAIALSGGPAAMSNFGYAGRLTETILLGNLALHAGPGNKVEWDAENLKATNNESLDQWVMREYADEWKTWM
ncbi:Inositol 2-dehydrogenase [Polystyrenella longa]|uniref:Inositol 2-dehydrogenase n=1 Tax=Polystyrenella longa TaxID=2528007 RepID=A0A518CLU4_9PLAN|nr:Gfo/Idh/MocA family oxidoreductase [Polystyrenella longa]QDU80187.1 Inositol 2-dehydrogenase [Polystyrenella longa]